MYKLGKHSKRKLKGVHPRLAFVVMEAIKITKQDFMVFCGVRSEAKQKQLRAQGRSWTNDSYHLYGLAVDLVAYVKGKPTWDLSYYKAIHTAMKEVMKEHNIKGIFNGQDLWGKDAVHWQFSRGDNHVNMKTIYDIRTI